MSREGLERRLRAILAERYHDHHPFNVRMHEGTLTAAEIRTWVRNRYYYQTRIPIKDGLILTKAEDPAFRREWIRRIHDHDGTPEREGGLELWLRLGEAVGLARAEVEVIVIERGDFPGAKNLFGGILFTGVLAELIPEFWDAAPVERHIVNRRWITLDEDSLMVWSATDLARMLSGERDAAPTETRRLELTVPRPPPDVDADQPPQGAMDAVCKYERYAEHRDQSSSCAGCHELVDPIGFGLENYDVAGRYREHDDGLPECIIDGSGEIVGIGEFNSPGELSDLLVENEYVDACAVKQFMTFALGRETTSYEIVPAQEAICSALTPLY